MNKFDELIAEGRDKQAALLFAEEYYKSGKMGHTRKRLIERLVERIAVLESRNRRIVDHAFGEVEKKEDEIEKLKAEIEELKKSQMTVNQNGGENYSIGRIEKLEL